MPQLWHSGHHAHRTLGTKGCQGVKVSVQGGAYSMFGLFFRTGEKPHPPSITNPTAPSCEKKEYTSYQQCCSVQFIEGILGAKDPL